MKTVTLREDTLNWWKELAVINPKDLVPRIEAVLASAQEEVADEANAVNETNWAKTAPEKIWLTPLRHPEARVYTEESNFLPDDDYVIWDSEKPHPALLSVEYIRAGKVTLPLFGPMIEYKEGVVIDSEVVLAILAWGSCAPAVVLTRPSNITQFKDSITHYCIPQRPWFPTSNPQT